MSKEPEFKSQELDAKLLASEVAKRARLLKRVQKQSVWSLWLVGVFFFVLAFCLIDSLNRSERSLLVVLLFFILGTLFITASVAQAVHRRIDALVELLENLGVLKKR